MSSYVLGEMPTRPVTSAGRHLVSSIAPVLPFGITWSAVGFSLRTTAAALISLYIALCMNFGDPRWAPMTVWIVAQSNRGMSLSKSRNRILGTLAGAMIGIVLIGAFSQTPELFIPALAIWLGVCTALATFLRNFRAYGAVLAGYTAAIVAMGAVNAPETVFDVAIARVENIIIGIAVEATLTAILAPGAPQDTVQMRLEHYLQQVTTACARALRGQATTVALNRLFADAGDLDTAAEYAAAGSRDVRRRLGHVKAATIAALGQLAVAQALHERLSALGDPTDGLVAQTAALLDTISQAPSDTVSMIRDLRLRVDAAFAAQVAQADDGPNHRLFLLVHLNTLLEAAHEAHMRLALLSGPNPPPSRLSFSFHADYMAAGQNGARAFAAVVAASLFWFGTAWPSGPNFLTILCVVCALFSTRQNAVAAGIGFFKGAAWATAAAAICNLALLPAVNTFSEFAAVTSVFSIAGGLAIRHPRTAAPGASFALFFWDLVAPQNGTRVPDVTFFNSAVALLLGIACGTIIFALILPTNLKVVRDRLRQAARHDLMHLARDPANVSTMAWASRMADRIARQLMTNSIVSATQADADFRGMLAALTIGDAAIALHLLATRHAAFAKPSSMVLRRLERGNIKQLSRASKLAAARLASLARVQSPQAQRSLLHGAILLQDIADSARIHAAFLCDRR